MTDLFSSRLAGVLVNLLDQGRTTASRTTDQQGNFSISNVKAGSYTIRAGRNGFIQEETNVHVRSQQTASVSLQLRPESLPSAAILSTRVISYTSTNMTFEIDVVVVDANSTAISDATFDIEDSTFPSGTFYDFTSQSSTLQGGGGGRPYSATLLLDQSGSITSTDPNDARIQASKIFLNSLGSSDNVVLSAFASGGRLSFDPVTLYGSGFTNNGRGYFSRLDALADLEGGGTPLYQSINTMIGYTRNNAPNANKAVVVFTDGDDTDGGTTIDEIAQNAQASGVEIYTIGLSSSVDLSVLAEIAIRTDGAFLWAADARQLVSMYGNLGNILSGSARFFRTRWQVSVSQPSFGPGAWFLTNLRASSSRANLRVPFQVRVPASGNAPAKGTHFAGTNRAEFRVF